MDYIRAVCSQKDDLYALQDAVGPAKRRLKGGGIIELEMSEP
jgi:hypothetical protein